MTDELTFFLVMLALNVAAAWGILDIAVDAWRAKRR